MIGWIFAKRTLVIEIGNYITHMSIVEQFCSKYTIIGQTSGPNPFFKNGIIQNKAAFIDSIVSILAKLKQHNWTEVIVGLDSSYIRYTGFNLQHSDKSILNKIMTMIPDSKVIWHNAKDNRLGTLSIQTSILEKLYLALEEANLHVTRFVPIKYFYVNHMGLPNPSAKHTDLTMIVNLGYKATNLSVFHGEFLIIYETVNLGVENIILALARKYNLSLEESKVVMKEISLTENDDREWVSYRDKNLNKKQVSSILNVYIQALTHKLIKSDYKVVNNTILTGWADQIEGIENVFQKLLTNVRTDNSHKQADCNRVCKAATKVVQTVANRLI